MNQQRCVMLMDALRFGNTVPSPADVAGRQWRAWTQTCSTRRRPQRTRSSLASGTTTACVAHCATDTLTLVRSAAASFAWHSLSHVRSGCSLASLVAGGCSAHRLDALKRRINDDVGPRVAVFWPRRALTDQSQGFAIWLVDRRGRVWFDDRSASDAVDDDGDGDGDDGDGDGDDDEGKAVVPPSKAKVDDANAVTVCVALRAHLDGATMLRAFYVARRLAMRVPAFAFDSLVSAVAVDGVARLIVGVRLRCASRRPTWAATLTRSPPPSRAPAGAPTPPCWRRTPGAWRRASEKRKLALLSVRRWLVAGDEKVLRLERRHAARAGRLRRPTLRGDGPTRARAHTHRDRLAPLLVLHVASGKDAGHVGLQTSAPSERSSTRADSATCVVPGLVVM